MEVLTTGVVREEIWVVLSRQVCRNLLRQEQGASAAGARRVLRTEPGRWEELPKVAYYFPDFSPPGSRLESGEAAVNTNTQTEKTTRMKFLTSRCLPSHGGDRLKSGSK